MEKVTDKEGTPGWSVNLNLRQITSDNLGKREGVTSKWGHISSSNAATPPLASGEQGAILWRFIYRSVYVGNPSHPPGTRLSRLHRRV